MCAWKGCTQIIGYKVAIRSDKGAHCSHYLFAKGCSSSCSPVFVREIEADADIIDAIADKLYLERLLSSENRIQSLDEWAQAVAVVFF